jgi:hypothetical protein
MEQAPPSPGPDGPEPDSPKSGYLAGHLDRPDALEREQFTITDLSAEFGVTARALRFYEDEGLIAPTRQGTARSIRAATARGWPGSCGPRMSGSAWPTSAR